MTNQLPYQDAARLVDSQLGRVKHDMAVVLGSGLGGFTKHLSDKKTIATNEIPGYPISTVVGHRGEIVSALSGEKRILVFSGRVHFYETLSATASAVTAIMAHHLGIKKIILTNAAGILNRLFAPGELMIVTDHINLTSRNVLMDLGCSLTGIDPIYSGRLNSIALSAASKINTELRSGVYIGLTGPAYETAAEVKYYRQLGGDAIGMSTIHEATFARHVGMEVLGISCLTNYSTGITNKKLSHSEVTDIGRSVSARFAELLAAIIEFA